MLRDENFLKAVESGDIKQVEEHYRRRYIDDGAKKYFDKESKITFLHRAAELGHLEIVKFLVERRAIINVTSVGFHTPLSNAAGKGHDTVVRYLLDQNADIKLGGSDQGSPLAQAVKGNRLSTIKLLLDIQPDIINQSDNNQNSPLHLAALDGDNPTPAKLPVIALLMERKADSALRNMHDHPPIKRLDHYGIPCQFSYHMLKYGIDKFSYYPEIRLHGVAVLASDLKSTKSNNVQIARRKQLPLATTTLELNAPSFNPRMTQAIQHWQEAPEFKDFETIIERALAETVHEIKTAAKDRLSLSPAQVDVFIIQKIFAETLITQEQRKIFASYAHTQLDSHITQAKTLSKSLAEMKTNNFADSLSIWTGRLEQMTRAVKDFGESKTGEIKRVELFNPMTDMLGVIGDQTLKPVINAVIDHAIKASQIVDSALKAVDDIKAELRKPDLNIIAQLEWEDKLQEAQHTLQGEQNNASISLKTISEGGQLIGIICNVLGKPELGRQVTTVVTAGIQIVDTLGKIVSGTLSGGPIGAITAIGGALLNIFGIGGGPSTEEVIQQLSQHMDERFDRIETVLEKLGQHIDKRFDRIEYLLDRITQHVDHRFDRVESMLSHFHENMHQRFDRLETILSKVYQETLRNFANLSREMGALREDNQRIIAELKDIEAKIDRGFLNGYESKYGDLKGKVKDLKRVWPKMDEDRAREARILSGELVRWGCENSKNQVLAGRSLVLEDDTLIEGVNTQGLLNQINFLMAYARKNYRINIPLGLTLANPVIWADVTRTYMQLIQTEQLQLEIKDDMSKLIQIGEDFNQFIIALKTNVNLFQQLIEKYRTALLEVLKQSYEKVLPGTSPESISFYSQVKDSQTLIKDNKDKDIMLEKIKRGMEKSATCLPRPFFILEEKNKEIVPDEKIPVMIDFDLHQLALLEKNREFKGNRPPHLLLMETYFSTKNPVTLTQSLSEELEKKPAESKLNTGLKNLTTAYQLLFAYVALAWSGSSALDSTLRLLLEERLWDDKDFRHAAEEDKPETGSLVFLTMQKQVFPALKELETCILSQVLSMKRAKEKDAPIPGYPLVDEVLIELKHFGKVYSPTLFHLPQPVIPINPPPLLHHQPNLL